MAADLEEITIDRFDFVDYPANPLAKTEMRKRLDPLAEARSRFDKRLKRAESKFYNELALIKSGQPTEKKRKKRRVMATEQTNFEEENEKQPEKIGPSAHNSPADYPVIGKAISDASRRRESELQRQADAYCKQVLSKGTTNPGRSGVDHAANLSAYERHRKENLFDRSAAMAKSWQGDGPLLASGRAAPALSNSYQTLMKMAEDLHASDPSRTVAQHFERIYTSAEFAGLAKADRDFDRNGRVDPAAAALSKAGGRTIPSAEADTDDGDEPCDEDLDGNMNDADESLQELGPERGPRGGAGTQSGGKSTATYRDGHNTMTDSPGMSGKVRSSGSYDDKKRSPSARRRM